MRRTTFSIVALIALAAPAAAQAPQPAKPGQPPTPPAAAQAVEAPKPAPAPDSTWSYDPEDRRDPFMSLLGRGNDPRDHSARPPGLAGLTIADVTVKGIVRDRAGFIAMLQAPDNKTYIVRPGDKLFDGSVKSIVADKVIFSQDVNDPLSLVKQREIPKPVRPAEGRGAPPGF
jgi:Tfp pilus assembly protein PilP